MSKQSTDSYAETAYRGEPGAEPAPGEAPAETSGVEAQLREYALLRQGPQCGEYLAIYEQLNLDAADPDSDTGGMYQKAGGLVWPSARNPAAFLPMIFMVSFIWLAAGLFGAFIAWANGDDVIPWGGASGTAWVVTFFTIIPLTFLIGSFLLMTVASGLSHKGNSVFRRHEGRFYPVNHSWDEPLAFADFDPYLARTSRGSGELGLKLMLCHRRERTRLAHPYDSVRDITPVWLRWELVQHYMDVRWPLPEVPECEPFRADDPTTAEADQRRGRPPYLLGNISEVQFHHLQHEASKAAANYPWGKTREEAKADGWEPSKYSQLQFGEISYEAFTDYLHEIDPDHNHRVKLDYLASPE
jgi:hypothetical protein